MSFNTDQLDTYVTCEMVNHCRVYLDICRTLSKNAIQTWVEEKVYLRHDMFGTVDFAALLDEGELLHLVDLKYGKGVPVYPDTPQAKYYALGILKALSKKIRKKLKWIRVTICQPRINNTNTQDFSVDELWDFYEVLMNAADDCDDAEEAYNEGRIEDVPLSPGSHCGFCRARHRCTALYDFVVNKGPMRDSWLGFAKAHHSGQKRNEFVREQVGLLSREEMENYFLWCDLSNRTSYAIKEKMTNLAASGTEFDTLKLVAGRSTRKWKDEFAAKAAMDKAEVEPYKKTLLSPAQAEKVMSVNKKLIESTEGKPALVSISDSRAAIKSKDKQIIDELFGDVS